MVFGGYKYFGKFHVLSGDVPLILGMDFLKSVQPCLDWKNGKVSCFVGKKRFDLPTCPIGNVDHFLDNNSFSGLKVDMDDAEHV